MGEPLQIDCSHQEIALNCIVKLKSRYPNFSSAQIASKIGMVQSTFSRIENKQTKPSINSLTLLLNAIGEDYKISDIVALSHKATRNEVSKNLKHNLNSVIKPGSFSDYFEQAEYRNIMLLALSQSGTTHQEIQAEFGNFGLKKLEELLNKKILIAEENKVKAPTNETYSFKQSTLKKTLISSIEKHYHPERFGDNSNWLSFQSNSIDKNMAMPKIRSILQNAYMQIEKEVLHSPLYRGTDKVFVGMASDILTNHFSGDQK